MSPLETAALIVAAVFFVVVLYIAIADYRETKHRDT